MHTLQICPPYLIWDSGTERDTLLNSLRIVFLKILVFISERISKLSEMVSKLLIMLDDPKLF